MVLDPWDVLVDRCEIICFFIGKCGLCPPKIQSPYLLKRGPASGGAEAIAAEAAMITQA